MNGPDAHEFEVRFVQRLQRLAGDGEQMLAAVSGGPDSMAMLELLHRTSAAHQLVVHVAHVDHGIGTESMRVADFVADAAGARGLTFHLRNLRLGSHASETTARINRRRALREIAGTIRPSAILLAHHADDQAETVLMRVLQGSGPVGLAAMKGRERNWLRPLLGSSRSELADYLAYAGVGSWADPANDDRRHLRSWIRTEVMPLLHERLPGLSGALLRTARLAGRDREAWREIPGLMEGLDLRSRIGGISVAAHVLQGYRSPLKYAVLAALGRRVGVLLGQRRLRAVVGLLAQGNDAQIQLDKKVRAELSFGRLALYRDTAVQESVRKLSVGETLVFGNVALTTFSDLVGEVSRKGSDTRVVPGEYLVRPWRAGDRVRPRGGAGSRAVAVLLREARIAPSLRKKWPVIVTADDATIVWVPGICRSDAAVPAEMSEAWRVECVVT